LSGFVVRDAKFRRVVVRTPQFQCLYDIRGMRPGTILLRHFVPFLLDYFIRGDSKDSFLEFFPEWESYYTLLKTKVLLLISSVNQQYQELSDKKDLKEFALAAQRTQYKKILFQMRKAAVDNFSKMVQVQYKDEYSLFERWMVEFAESEHST
jgi:hypothetical protein